ncbi:MAG: RNA polymerase sigma factor [Pseudomonadales bacterium]
MQVNLFVDETLKAFHTDDLADDVFIRRTQNGDHEAFGVLWKRHSPKVRAIVNRFVQRSADAEDLTQDVFLKAFVALPRFRGDCQFFSWLYRIAFNVGINFTKAGSRVEWTNIEGLEEKTTHTDPERIWIGKEMQRAANAAIDGLAPAVQQALMLNTHKGLNYETVSAVVGCPTGTVRSRISRARQVVSAALAEE